MNARSIARRRFLKAMAAGTAGAALAACAPAATPQVIEKEVTRIVEGTPQIIKETVVVEKEAEPAKKEEVFLTWSWWGSVEQLERNSAKTKPFRDKFPYVELEPVYPSNYTDKILTMFAGGSAPDVIMVDAYYAPDWFSRGLALELDPFLDKDPEASRDDWIEVFLEDMTLDDKLYGLPTDCGPMIWQYNTQIVGECGKPTPLEYYEQDNWNWDTHIELGLACTDEEKNVFFRDDFYYWVMWMPMAWTYGGEYFNEDESKCLVDSEPFVTAIQYTLDMMEKHKIMPPPGASQELGLSYRSGNLAMRSAWPRQPMNRAVALGGIEMVQPCYVAAGPEGAKCITKSNNFCVCSQTKQPELCYELVKVLCGPEGEMLEQEQFKFIFPGTKANYNNPDFWAKGAWDQSVQRVSNEEHGHRLPITRKIPWLQMNSIWTQYTDQVWIGEMTPEECCSSIAADINKLLEAAQS